MTHLRTPAELLFGANLAELGIIPSATVRLPLLEPPPHHLWQLREALAALRFPV